MEKCRIVWLDNVKAFGIFLVVFAHFISSSSYFDIDKLIYGFHMPLFFFLSGYLSKYRIKHYTFSLFVKTKFLSLVKPYVIYSILGFSFYCLFTILKESNPFSLQAIFEIITAKCRDLYKFYTVPLWFLICLFIVEVHFYFLSKLKRVYEPVIVVILCCLTIFIFADEVLPFNLNIAWLVMPFYLLGNRYEELKNKVTISSKYKNILWVALAVAYIYIVKRNSFVDLSFLQWGNTTLYYVGSTLGIILSVEFFKKYHTNIKIFVQMGVWSLYILCLHWFFVAPFRKFAYHNESISKLGYFVFGTVMSIFAVLLIMGFLHLRQQLKYKRNKR